MKTIYLFLALLITADAVASDKVIHIYQDADISRHKESSVAIQKGIEVAFDEIGYEIEGHKVVFKYLDHRGNVIRSKRNYQTFLEDPKALVIFSGIHSPPLIKNRAFINENQALTLVPWAAGGPITRYPSQENWIFRLSIDDTQAGAVIIDHAMNKQACKKPHLLLEDTPWGDSNLASMSKALSEYNDDVPSVSRFSWNLKGKGARLLLRQILDDRRDCIVLVGNAVEGVVIAQAVADLPQEEQLPIISHWGITGGNFHERVGPKVRETLNLHFIQSCFAFTNPIQTAQAKSVFERLKGLSEGEITQAEDLKSAVGFIHAYDLTKLLIQSIKQTGLNDNMQTNRNAIRLALENLTVPVKGLVKTYQKPFSVFDVKTNVNAHEALHQENYCMGKYGSKDEILISR